MGKRRHEAIAPPCQGSHISRARLTITERLAKRSDMKPEAPSSTVVSGQTRSSSSFLLTTLPEFSTRTMRISSARAPRWNGVPVSLEHSSRYI